MTEYVLVDVIFDDIDHKHNVLLIEKQKPDWQKGRFNLIGGKVEEGETPIHAAIRELKEEYYPLKTWFSAVYGKIVGSWGVVHCVSLGCEYQNIPQTCQTDEGLVFHTSIQMALNSPELMPNLKIIIPLMRNHIRDWVIYDEGDSLNRDDHTISLTLKNLKGN